MDYYTNSQDGGEIMTNEELKVIENQFDEIEVQVSDLLKKVEFGDITRNDLERELIAIKKLCIYSFNYIKNEDWK